MGNPIKPTTMRSRADYARLVEGATTMLTDNEALVEQRHRDAAGALWAIDGEDGLAEFFARFEQSIRTTDAARIAELEVALQKLADLPIEENDSPDTIHLNGEAHQGPVVDWTFKVIRKVKEIARTTLKEQHR